MLRTAQDIFALDKAFFLIEGHPVSVGLRGRVVTPRFIPSWVGEAGGQLLRKG